MNVPYDPTLTDPSLKQIVQYFFGHECSDEYAEYRFIRNPADSAKPFEFGPMLVGLQQTSIPAAYQFRIVGYDHNSEKRSNRFPGVP